MAKHGVLWLTDLHFNFLSSGRVAHFLGTVAAQEPTALLLGGDMGEAGSVIGYLQQIATAIPCPIYFVLGNHDFYYGSIRQVRAAARDLRERYSNLIWLPAADPQQLAPGVGLIGHDGWADARVGDYERSMVMMNDYRLIAELAGVGKRERLPLLRALGDEAAAHIHRVLPLALQQYPQVLLLTHVPPLREACWHEGRLSDDEWAPHFTCLALGEAILEIMAQHPDQQLTVLCGHTHSPGECQPLPNVRMITGHAQYERPEIQSGWAIQPGANHK